jgi:hypothetical protein
MTTVAAAGMIAATAEIRITATAIVAAMLAAVARLEEIATTVPVVAEGLIIEGLGMIVTVLGAVGPLRVTVAGTGAIGLGTTVRP